MRSPIFFRGGLNSSNSLIGMISINNANTSIASDILFILPTIFAFLLGIIRQSVSLPVKGFIDNPVLSTGGVPVLFVYNIFFNKNKTDSPFIVDVPCGVVVLKILTHLRCISFVPMPKSNIYDAISANSSKSCDG